MTVTIYCGHCGLPLSRGATDTGQAQAHDSCARRLELDPPRYCPRCRRRMVVQVAPDRWTARCAEHGETVVSTWARA